MSSEGKTSETAELSVVEIDGRWPEHEKMAAITDDSQTIGLFLDTCGYTLCEWIGETDEGEGVEGFYPVRGGINAILATYFQIDMNEIEREKRAMLDQLRKQNA